MDECSFCDSSVDYQRIAVGSKDYALPSKDLSICHNCGRHLWKAPPKFLDVKRELISTPYISFLKAFHNKYSVHKKLGQPLNLQAFNGLRVLISAILSKRGEQIRDRIFKDIGIRVDKGKSREIFEFLTLSQRLNIMVAVLFYLEDWPERFYKLIKNTPFSLCVFSDSLEKVPYWLNTLVSHEINMKKYVVTEQEISSVIAFLKVHDHKCNKQSVADLLGIHVTSLNKRLGKN